MVVNTVMNRMFREGVHHMIQCQCHYFGQRNVMQRLDNRVQLAVETMQHSAKQSNGHLNLKCERMFKIKENL